MQIQDFIELKEALEAVETIEKFQIKGIQELNKFKKPVGMSDRITVEGLSDTAKVLLYEILNDAEFNAVLTNKVQVAARVRLKEAKAEMRASIASIQDALKD